VKSRIKISPYFDPSEKFIETTVQFSRNRFVEREREREREGGGEGRKEKAEEKKVEKGRKKKAATYIASITL